MFLLASASASCNLPLTLLRGFFICLLVCLLFSNLLYDLDDLYPNGKCLISHLSQFLLRKKKKTLRPRDDHQGCSLLSTFEDPLFGGERAVSVDFFLFLIPFLVILHAS